MKNWMLVFMLSLPSLAGFELFVPVDDKEGSAHIEDTNAVYKVTFADGANQYFATLNLYTTVCSVTPVGSTILSTTSPSSPSKVYALSGDALYNYWHAAGISDSDIQSAAGVAIYDHGDSGGGSGTCATITCSPPHCSLSSGTAPTRALHLYSGGP